LNESSAQAITTAKTWNLMLKANKKIRPKILAIDDKKENLLALEAVLDDFDCDLYCVTSGDAGLKLVLEHEFALALLDVQMPKMNGFEVAGLIRGIKKSKYLPIIFVTALNQHPAYQFKGYEAGAVDFLFKPFDPKILKSKVDIFLELYRSKQLIENQKLELEEKLKILEKTKKAAEAANQTKSDFLSIMSHEIRTPMNAIMGFTQLVLKTELNSKQSLFLEKIQYSANNLLVIINDILDFSKIEAGKLNLEAMEFALEPAIANIASQEMLKTQKKGLELLFYIEPEVPTTLIGDSLRLGQVLLNLLSNAIKFTDKGQVLMTVKTEKTTDTDILLQFSIQDTGIGLSEQQIANLFQPFTQADPSTTRKYGGTGLGLSICHRLVEMMDGRLWVDSEPGKGSTFHFTAQFKAGKKRDQEKFLPPELEGLRILLVDDNLTALKLLKRMLEVKDFQITACAHPDEALREMKQAVDEGQPYDMAILDWGLPKMNGTDLAKKIQEYPGLTEKPKVILVSASSNEEIENKTKGGWDGILLSKPVSSSALFNAMVVLFKKQESEADPVRKISIDESDHVKQIAGASILLVEDNNINQELALELLKNAGVQAQVANNGVEALGMLKKKAFDGVLMDVEMPEMDGLTATCEIRKQKKFKKLPIIAMTANVLAKHRKAAEKAGMNDYIVKPINEQELLSTMAKWIKPMGFIEQEQVGQPRSLGKEGNMEIPEIEGIDVKAGLAIAQENQTLYRRLLGMFRDGQRDFVERFQAAQKNGDMKTLKRIAHTLKGVAGNVGAKKVQEVALKLERDCEEHRPETEIEVRLEKVEQALLPVIASLDELDASHGETTDGAADASPYELKEQLKDLAQLLIRSDTIALDFVEPMPDQPGAQAYSFQLTELKEKIHNYEFDAALELIGNLTETL
jgi:two-component system sensor histidine kinase/response regulator